MKRFATSADSETDGNIWETVEDAYVYAFPLVLMDATETSATNTEEVVAEKAPVNQFIHSVALADAQFRTVVTPNVDTIYSQVWYDLSEEPMVYELPETDRFCKVQVLDGWTNTAAVLEGGFWSVTAYGDDDFLIDNPVDRYCINDRSDLKANDDGSVDIILSEDAPENTTNWLPVGDGGFHLYMRIYTPDMDALDTWTAPTITEIAPSNVN